MHSSFREDVELRQGLRVLPPGERIMHPHQVLRHPALSRDEKRAVLAEWASDSCALEGRPAWRQIPGSGATIAVDDIFDALRALDRGQSSGMVR
jgi:hypothetical protein